MITMYVIKIHDEVYVTGKQDRECDRMIPTISNLPQDAKLFATRKLPDFYAAAFEKSVPEFAGKVAVHEVVFP